MVRFTSRVMENDISTCVFFVGRATTLDPFPCIGSMGLVYLPTFTMKINQMWVNIPYMDPMGMELYIFCGGPKKTIK